MLRLPHIESACCCVTTCPLPVPVPVPCCPAGISPSVAVVSVCWTELQTGLPQLFHNNTALPAPRVFTRQVLECWLSTGCEDVGCRTTVIHKSTAAAWAPAGGHIWQFHRPACSPATASTSSTCTPANTACRWSAPAVTASSAIRAAPVSPGAPYRPKGHTTGWWAGMESPLNPAAGGCPGTPSTASWTPNTTINNDTSSNKHGPGSGSNPSPGCVACRCSAATGRCGQLLHTAAAATASACQWCSSCFRCP